MNNFHAMTKRAAGARCAGGALNHSLAKAFIAKPQVAPWVQSR
jgi:hypothetical protein